MTPTTTTNFDQTALDAMADPVGYHNAVVYPREMALEDSKRYADYANQCANAALSLKAGRLAAWPTMPHEVGTSTDPSNFGGLAKYADPSTSGSRTLDQIDPVNFPPIQPPPDAIGTPQSQKPQGVIQLGPEEVDNGVHTGFFAVGVDDTWPAGVKTPPEPSTGNIYIKFSFAGMGGKAYKYMKTN